MTTRLGTYEPKDTSDSLCQNCEERPGTHKWVGEGGHWALTHGAWWWWCLPCCLKAELEFARKAAECIPELAAQLEKLGVSYPPPSRTGCDPMGYDRTG